MASVHKLITQILVFTTPKELRELADKMEDKIKKDKLGDSTTTAIWSGNDYDIHIAYDQTEV